MRTYCNIFFEERNCDATKLGMKEEENDDVADLTSLDSVLDRLPMFHEIKSMLEVIVKKPNHKLLLGSKCHAEVVAGQGIRDKFFSTQFQKLKLSVSIFMAKSRYTNT